jgi:hypothetical protein
MVQSLASSSKENVTIVRRRVAAQTVGQGPMKKRVKGRLVQYFMPRALD